MEQRTKYKIIKSLIELLEYCPSDEITIKVMYAYSGVNRSTFYDHLQDKYQLLDKIQNYHLNKYISLLQSFCNDFHHTKTDQKKLCEFFLSIAKYIKREEAFYRATLITYLSEDIALDYINVTKTCYEKVMNRYETSIDNKRMLIIYSVGDRAGVFIDWLHNGYIESLQEVARVLLASTIKLQR